jgi:hypothetical protein
MKEIKIRFILENEKYRAERKTLFGWRSISYVIDMGYGSIGYYYTGTTKEELLAELLENYYKMDKRFVRVIEYPTILVY